MQRKQHYSSPFGATAQHRASITISQFMKIKILAILFSISSCQSDDLESIWLKGNDHSDIFALASFLNDSLIM